MHSIIRMQRKNENPDGKFFLDIVPDEKGMIHPK
jgi:hypothetical protein